MLLELFHQAIAESESELNNWGIFIRPYKYYILSFIHISLYYIISAIGLFHQAIAESGSELNDWGINLPDSHPEDYTYNVAEDLGCTRADDYEMMDCMRDLPWREIMFNSSITCTV